MEGYKGVKFNSICVENITPKDEKVNELMKWCKKFDELGLAPPYEGGSYGNLSFRTKNGFIITCSNTAHGSASENDFAEVVDCKLEQGEMNVYYKGRGSPSSEAFLHFEIYKIRSDINAIFHGHDVIVLGKYDKMKIECTEEEKPYGTIELMEQVKNLLVKYQNSNYFMWKNYGICSLGKTMEEAGQKAVEIHEKAKVVE